MILLAIVAGQPRELGLIPMIKLFIEHRVDVVRRRTIFELKKAEQREHILLGYQIALDHLDNVIRIIRGSTSRAEAKENLLQVFYESGRHDHRERFQQETRRHHSGSQEIRLARRCRAELCPDRRHPRIAVAPSHATLDRRDSQGIEVHPRPDRELREILNSDRKLKSVIIGELKEVHKAYGDDRRTADRRQG